MRFAAIDLVAFGRFENRRLEFPVQGPERQGFHLVHGPNEAGKSTLLAALSGLLFGIHERSPYGFVERTTPLTVGGEVEAPDGARLAFRRIKRRKDPLLDAEGEPLAEERLARMLGGVSKDFFERVFRLDHDRLVQAEKDLLADGGDLGFSLFQAGTGIGHVNRLVADLVEEAGQRFKPGGQKPVVNAAMRDLLDARRREQRLSLRPDDWDRLQADCADAAAAVADCRERLQSLTTERRRLERVQRSLKPLATCMRLRTELEGPLAAVPDLPEDAPRRLDAAIRARDLAAARIAEAQEQIAPLEALLAEAPAEPGILAHAGEIKALVEKRGAILDADADVAKQQDRIAVDRAALRDKARQIGIDPGPGDGAPALPPRPQVNAVRRLIEAHGTIQAERKAVRRGFDEAADALRRTEAEQRGLPDVIDFEALQRRLRTLSRSSDPDHALAEARRARDAACRSRESRLTSLPLFDGEPGDLAGLPVPLAETRRRIARRWSEIEEMLSERRRRAGDCKAAVDQVRSDLAGVESAGAVPTEAALADARAARDAALESVRLRLDEGRSLLDGMETVAPVDALAERIADADRVADRLRADADRVATHARLTREATSAAGRLAEVQADLEAAEADHAALLKEWVDAWRGCGFTPLPPAEMERWLETREAVLAAQQAVEEAEAATVAAEETAHRLHDQLSRLMRQLTDATGGETPLEPADDVPFGELLDTTQRVLDDVGRAENRREGLVQEAAKQKSALAKAERELAALDADLEAWRSDWVATLAAAWLPGTDDPDRARDWLTLLDEMREQETTLGENSRRLAGIHADRRAFDRRVTDLARRAMPDRFPGTGTIADTVQASRDLERAFHEADQAARRRAEAETALSGWQAKLQDGHLQRRQAEADLKRLYDLAGCGDESELRAIIEAAGRKRQVRADLAAEAGRLTDDWQGKSLDAIAEACADQDSSAVEAALSANEAEHPAVEQADEAARNRLAELNARRRALGGDGDAAIDAAQEAEGLAARIREEASAHAVSALAAAMLRRAVDRYRERNEGPVLARARTLFADLTNGAFAGLDVDYDRDGRPQLVGIRATAGGGGAGLPPRVSVSAMSTGTRDQLYLALRLAAMLEHARQVGPLPFVADDLLIQFDDPRSRATLRVLDQIADQLQVVFLTHHDAMRRLATEEIPKDRIDVVSLAE